LVFHFGLFHVERYDAFSDRVYFALTCVEEVVPMDWLRDVNPGVVSMLIPIVAIICGAAYVITMAVIHHRERMAMIERGMNPDTIRQQK
jgi:hypothetical protein